MDLEDESSSFKKRKVQRACDFCRRRKVRCDGPQTPSNQCYNCIASGVECTYVEALPRRTYPSRYVEGLQNRLERMEKLVAKLLPDGDTSKMLETPQCDRNHPPQAETSSRRESPRSLSPPPLTVAPQTPTGSGELNPSNDDPDDVESWLTDCISKLSLGTHASRYHGKSSGILFIRDVLELKDEIAPDQSKGQERPERLYPWLSSVVGEEIPVFDGFPPEDLMSNLVELYFRNTNDFLPLLHEPTFKKGIKGGLHLRDGGFGATVLLVCANGTRFSRDPRVGSTNKEDSAGWKWFHKVERVRKPPLAPAQLYDLQMYMLMVTFLHGTVAPQATWMLVGIGIRAAIDVGAHRRRMYNTPPTPEQELWKRAFWNLVVLDWLISYVLGRPASIHDEDIDVGLPIEVDDEYWTTDDGQPLFKQPIEKPAKTACFNWFVRLVQMLAFAGRTLYSINKSKVQRGEQQWEQRTVAELDSALNEWAASLPNHLRWDPNQQDLLFLNQAAWLSANHNQFQIAFHRPFISAPVPHREPSSSVPSLIICTHAARASVQVLDTLCQRTGTPHCNNMGSLFIAGIVLMMNVLGERRSGRIVHAEKDFVYVQKCMDMLKLLHREMAISQCIWDILNDLMMAAKTPPSQPSSSMPQEGAPSKAESTAATSSASIFPYDTGHQHAADTAVGGISHIRPGAETQPVPSFASITFAQPESGAQSTSQLSNLNLQHSQGYLIPRFGLTDGFNPTFSYNRPPRQSLPSEYSPNQPTSLKHPTENNAPSQITGSPSTELDFGLTDGDGSMSMFGLEPLGYSETASWQPPPPPVPGVPADGAAYAPQDLRSESQPNPWIATTSQGGDADEKAMPDIDIAFLDGALTMWSSAPTTFGWDDWGAYRNNVNDTSHASSGSG